MADRPPHPPKPLTDAERALIRTHARLMAVIVLGPKDPRIDLLTSILAHRALNFGRLP